MVELTARTKLVYVLNRNAEGKLFPSSPLEAHKNHALVTNIIGVDQVSFANPILLAKLIVSGLR
jgi:splicing factor 3B subunit 3